MNDYEWYFVRASWDPVFGQFVTLFFSGSVDTTAGVITSVSWTKDRAQALTFRDYELFLSFRPEFRSVFPDVDTVFFKPDDDCRAPRLAAALDDTELRRLRRILGAVCTKRYPEYEDMLCMISLIRQLDTVPL